MMEKYIKCILVALLLVAMVSCSVSRKIERRYNGATREVLIKERGEPKQIVKLDNGAELYLYEKETFVRETTFSTGRNTLDPRVSPAYVKVEVYSFKIDKNGKIISTFYEKNYR